MENYGKHNCIHQIIPIEIFNGEMPRQMQLAFGSTAAGTASFSNANRGDNYGKDPIILQEHGMENYENDGHHK